MDREVTETRVALVCVPELLRLGLASLLASSSGLSVVAHSRLPDPPRPAHVAILCERGLGDLAAACADALDRIGAELVVVLAEADVHLMLDCAAAGASGFVLESEAATELAAAVHAAARGECFLAQPLLGLLLAYHRAQRPRRRDQDRELLRLLAGGRATGEIAERLGVAPKTVRNRSSLLYRALGVRSRRAAIEAAERRGLLD